MALEPEDVLRIARLAHLELPGSHSSLWSETALAKLAQEIDAIVEHVGELQQLDLDNVPPTAHAVELAPHPRADKATEPLSPELALREAPASRDGAFRVPKVIDS